MNPITLVGLSIIFFYSLSQILKFYGIGEDIYGIYILFYIFIILCILILGLMNTYWFILISKKGLTNHIGYNIFEYRPAINDPFLLQIEELRAKIHSC